MYLRGRFCMRVCVSLSLCCLCIELVVCALAVHKVNGLMQSAEYIGKSVECRGRRAAGRGRGSQGSASKASGTVVMTMVM